MTFLPMRIFIAIFTSSQGTPFSRSLTAWHSALELGALLDAANVSMLLSGCCRPLAVEAQRACASSKHFWSCSKLVLNRRLRVALQVLLQRLRPLHKRLLVRLGMPPKSPPQVLLLSLQPGVMLTFENTARVWGLSAHGTKQNTAPDTALSRTP